LTPRRTFPGFAKSTNAHTMPDFGIVCSRDTWPHLNPHDDQDEFCLGMEYTGTTLVAVTEPATSLSYFHRDLELSRKAAPNVTGSSANSTATTPGPIETASDSLSFIRSPPQSTRITHHGPSTATDPFARLSPNSC